MDLEILKSYMVQLGFTIDQPALRKFDLAMKDAPSAIETQTAGIAKELLKWQSAITSAFVAVSGAVVGTADHIAMADQSFRLFGLTMFLSQEQARKLKIGMDSLGASLEQIAWDPELRQRFLELSDLQDRLVVKLGPDFERNMRLIRDLRFELTRLHVEVQYMAMRFASSLFKAFGTDIDGVLAKLHEWESWFVEHMPQISDWLARNFVPILKTTRAILTDTGEAIIETGIAFTNFIGLLSGDTSIEGTTADFDKFGRAVQHVAEFFRQLNGVFLGVEKTAAHLVSGLSLLASGKWADAKKELQAAADAAGANDPSIDLAHPFTRPEGYRPSERNPDRLSELKAGFSDIASQARVAALKAGSRLGIDPRLIFEQWQHETGNFSSRVAKDDNNLAGIRNGVGYRHFDSIDAFANYYAGLLQNKRYTSQGILQAKTEEDFAGALKRGGYYEDSYDNYVNGMKRFARIDAGTFAQGAAQQTVTIGEINIPITQPGASPEDIHKAVSAGISDALGRQTQRTLPQLAYVG